MIPGFSDALITFDDGSGPALYVGARFNLTPGPTPTYEYTVGRWNGRSWLLLNATLPQSSAGPWLRVLDDGSGPHLYVLGMPFWARRWNGTVWEPVPAGLFNADPGFPRPILSADLGDGMAIYGHVFLPNTNNALARWTGSDWVVLGGYSDAQIYSRMTVFDDGSGPAIIAVGGFSQIGAVPLRGIGKWNGQQWSPLGTGIAIAVNSMAVYDDGRGPALYIVGAGSEAGGVPVRNIARWDGREWSDVGGGTGGCAGCPSVLYSAEVFDDGTGSALYVGGYVASAGGVPVQGIARWDGLRWSALGPGASGVLLDDMAVFDDGRGPSLFVASTISAGGGRAPGIAQWVGCPNCYADCDNDERLNVADFVCFSQKYAARDPYANCTVDPTIDVADFVCFMYKFAQGCGR